MSIEMQFDTPDDLPVEQVMADFGFHFAHRFDQYSLAGAEKALRQGHVSVPYGYNAQQHVCCTFVADTKALWLVGNSFPLYTPDNDRRIGIRKFHDTMADFHPLGHHAGLESGTSLGWGSQIPFALLDRFGYCAASSSERYIAGCIHAVRPAVMRAIMPQKPTRGDFERVFTEFFMWYVPDKIYHLRHAAMYQHNWPRIHDYADQQIY